MKKTFITKLVHHNQCLELCNEEWKARHEDILAKLLEQLPSGSGFDQGTSVLEVSNTKVVFQCDYHHMNDAGYYVEWTCHKITATPRFDGFDLKISGRNKNDIKDYIAEVFYDLLGSENV